MGWLHISKGFQAPTIWFLTSAFSPGVPTLQEKGVSRYTVICLDLENRKSMQSNVSGLGPNRRRKEGCSCCFNCPMTTARRVIDDGDVSDVHLTGFQHAGEDVELIFGEKGHAR